MIRALGRTPVEDPDIHARQRAEHGQQNPDRVLPEIGH